MARDTLHLFAGFFLSLAIVASVSVAARMLKWQAVEAAASPLAVACER